MKEPCESDIPYTSDKRISYAFNKSERLNSLLIDIPLQTDQLLKGQLSDLNFNNQFIVTKRYDTVCSY